MGLARPLVAEHRHDLGVRRRVVPIEIDDAEKLLALRGEQFRHVVTGAHLIIRVTGKVVAEGVARAAQDVQGSFR